MAESFFLCLAWTCLLTRWECVVQCPGDANEFNIMTNNINTVIRSLNWLAGCKDSPSIPYSQMQEDVLARLEGLVYDQKPSGAGLIPDAEGALRELLRGSSPYDGQGSNECLASYKAELVSVPSDTRGCPALTDCLPPDDGRYVEEGSELMLRATEDMPCVSDLPVPYWDSKLKFNRKQYNKLVSRLHQIGFFNYTLSPACHVGVFFVWKSNKTKLRLITDARRSNAHFKEPPGVSLITAEGLGRIEVELDGDLWNDPTITDHLAFHLGLSDVKDCFHRMKVPVWLSKYFAWDAVPAKVVGLQGTMLEGKVLSPLDAVYPCAGSLCQGFSWSLYFAQRVNQYKCQTLNCLSSGRLVNDRSPPIVMKIGGTSVSHPHYYVYVDNLGVLHHDRQVVEEAMAALEQSFNSAGLELHTTDISEGAVKALGCIVEGDKLRSRVSENRLWKIHKAIQALLRRKKSTGKALEIIVGHCNFAGLMNRCSLSCFSSIYKFILKHYDTPSVMWDSVRDELAGFSGCLFLLVQDWQRPWNELVSSSDASEEGYGICHSWWDRSEVAEVGRTLERSRFRRSSGHSARESALHAAGFELSEKGWVKSAAGAAALADAGWEIVSGFPEVPAASLRRELWHPKMWGKWRRDDDILVLEGRAVLKSLKRIALTRFGHDLRQLLLCDNMSVVLSFERCRSKNFKLLSLIRRFAAYCFSRNIHVAIRWIPSELNISDEPSRDFKEGESKLLIDLLDEPLPSSRSKGVSGVFCNGPKTGQNTHTRQQQQQQPWTPRTSGLLKEARTGALCRDNPDQEGCSEADRGFEHSAKIGGSSEGDQPQPLQLAFQLAGADHVGRPPEEITPIQAEGHAGRRDKPERQHLVRSQGREKRRQEALFRKTAKGHLEEAGRRQTGQRGESDHSGNLRCDSKGQRPVYQKDAGVGKLPGSQAVAFQEKRRHRLCLSDLLQPEVLGRRAELLWGLHSSGPDGYGSQLQQGWGQEDSSSLAQSPRLAPTLSQPFEACVTSPSLVWDQLANDSSRPLAESHLQPDPVEQLPSTRSPLEVEKAWTGSSYFWNYGVMVPCDFTDRNPGCLQDGDERRQYLAGFGVHPVPPSFSAGTFQGKKRGAGLELHVRRVPLSLSSLLPGPEDPSSPLPGQAFRAKHRPSQWSSNSGRSEEAGGVAVKEDCSPIRKSWKACSHLAKVATRSADGLPCRREVHGRDFPRPKIPRHSAPMRNLKGQYVADFFAGHGGVSRAVRKVGFTCREWEILKGPEHDLTHPCVVSKILADVSKCKIIAAMLAPPCSSFSPARDRTRVIRSKEYPWGLPDLPLPEQDKVAVGNRCFRSALRIIKALDSHKIPWILENPHSSKCWYLPGLRRLAASAHVHTRVLDFCQYGTPWRKRIRFLLGNIDSFDSLRLDNRLCSGHGVCSQTDKRHFHLTGSNKQGVPWTRISQPYPPRLCHDLAYVLVAPQLVVPYYESSSSNSTHTYFF